jgi:hypothetical protein
VYAIEERLLPRVQELSLLRALREGRREVLGMRSVTPSARRAVVLALMLCVPTGCATKYPRVGATGGYSDTQLGPDIFRVEFSGKGFTWRSRVENLLLYRCAELTVKGGFSHFAILTGDTTAGTSDVYVPGSTTGSATVIRNSVYWNQTTNPGQHIPITKYGSTVMIRAFDGAPPDVPGAFDAQSLMSYLAPSVGTKHAQQWASIRTPAASASALPPPRPAEARPTSSPLGQKTLASMPAVVPVAPRGQAAADYGNGASVPTEINSIPSNAEVYVDGAFVGTTPLAAYPLPAGTRQVELVRKGFANWKRSLRINLGAPTRVVAEMEAGVPAPVSPAVHTPEPSLTVAKKAPDPIVPDPNAVCALTVRTQPRQVEVFVAGRSMGFTTPDGLKVKVPPGAVLVELRHEGYRTEQHRYEATADRSKTLRVVLRKEH